MLMVQRDPPQILIADDDPLFTSLAAACLAKDGFRTRVADDGAEALEAMDSHSFDLTIVDLDMPRIDGFRLIGLIRGAAKWRHLGVLVVSGSKKVSDVEEALGLGADAFLQKPVDWVALPTTVKRVLAARRPSPSSAVMSLPSS